MRRVSGAAMLAELLQTAGKPVKAQDIANHIERQKSSRSMDYLFPVQTTAGGFGSFELVTKPGWFFVITGLAWWAENDIDRAEIRLEQLDTSSGNFSGGAAGVNVGFIPADCFGGFVSYLEEPADFLRYVGDNAYLRANVHNQSAAPGVVYVLASGFEVRA